jgi:hypothetical protein
MFPETPCRRIPKNLGDSSNRQVAERGKGDIRDKSRMPATFLALDSLLFTLSPSPAPSAELPSVARVRDTYGSGNPPLHPESAKLAPLLIGPATRRPWLWAAKSPDPTRAPMPRADRSSTQFCDSFPAKQRDSRGTRNKRGTKISRASRKSSRSEGGKGW